ncbi:cysteine proteinase inhibitor B [Jatropha curcas]|uniref:cysteine proteinase inhibitor B n=1 Tax=Jatropha curcas TaxID=180498 RepID=UPI0009D70DB4|nr:cysteine proteinase inhibitor B [Jatropha curcas]
MIQYKKQKREMAKIVELLLLLASAFLFVSLANGYRGMVGGRTEVKDVETNQEVQDLGKFSVEEFNEQIHRHGNGGEELIFSEVVEAQRQVVSGIKYYLKIEAATKVNGEMKVFDSVVVVKAWLESKELISFEPDVKLRVRK